MLYRVFPHLGRRFFSNHKIAREVQKLELKYLDLSNKTDNLMIKQEKYGNRLFLGIGVVISGVCFWKK